MKTLSEGFYDVLGVLFIDCHMARNDENYKNSFAFPELTHKTFSRGESKEGNAVKSSAT